MEKANHKGKKEHKEGKKKTYTLCVFVSLWSALVNLAKA